MSNHAKDLRKQLRNVVQELLPEILKTELQTAIQKDLLEKMNSRMDLIGNNAARSINLVEQRQKELQDYVVRQLTLIPVQPKKD